MWCMKGVQSLKYEVQNCNSPKKYTEKLLNCTHIFFFEKDTRSIDRKAEIVKGDYTRLNISCTVEETWKHVIRAYCTSVTRPSHRNQTTNLCIFSCNAGLYFGLSVASVPGYMIDSYLLYKSHPVVCN